MGNIFLIILQLFCFDTASVVLSGADFDVRVLSGFPAALVYKQGAAPSRLLCLLLCLDIAFGLLTGCAFVCTHLLATWGGLIRMQRGPFPRLGQVGGGFPLHCRIAIVDGNLRGANFDVRGGSGLPIALVYNQGTPFSLLVCNCFALARHVWFCQVRFSMLGLLLGFPPP